MERCLLCNKIQTPDGTILESHSRHQCVMHYDTITGNLYMTDGGLDYLHRMDNGDEIDLSVYSDDPHEKIRENVTWGSFGKSGKEKFKWILLKDMTDEHIEAVLRTQLNIYPQMRQAMENELDYRTENKLI